MSPTKARRPETLQIHRPSSASGQMTTMTVDHPSAPEEAAIATGGVSLGQSCKQNNRQNPAHAKSSWDFTPLTTPSAEDYQGTVASDVQDTTSSVKTGPSVLFSKKLENTGPPKDRQDTSENTTLQDPSMLKLFSQLNLERPKQSPPLGFDNPQQRPETHVPGSGTPETASNNADGPTSAEAAVPAIALRSDAHSPSASSSDNSSDPHEVLRLKMQLAQAQNHISKLDQALMATGRDAKSSSETDMKSLWSSHEESHSNQMETASATTFSATHDPWSRSKSPYTYNQPPARAPVVDPAPGSWFAGGKALSSQYAEPEVYPVLENFRPGRDTLESDSFMRPVGGARRGHRLGQRQPSPLHPSSLVGYQPGMAPFGSLPIANHTNNVNGLNLWSPVSPASVPSFPHYQQVPGTSLSPHASEFMSTAPSQNETAADGPFYLPPTEPLNYRRLLDRNVNCDWKYIVDKIVCNNDQQASIFLQQKLKVGTSAQKYEIVEAIVAQAYPLMVNRFGNFLVQRCFEHGTPEQVIKIAESIRGNTLNLSMDPFGCHVVQKAFDSVPEEYKAIMVHELLRRIPETVIHRYACHVWQKLFELRWTESPPQIMKHVNQNLCGMWHEVALGETGSLVVQNIFENCLEEDKRPCIEEVLLNIDIVAHGQFGNWCIQHICEHSAPPDRSRAIDHVIRYAAEYSTDQFASKVVEKCLKIGGADFLGRYLDRVCEGRQDRTRIPLIDIASDQYGNYLIQWILNNSSPQHREIVAAHIRKHMVSLRGSKFGSRVGMLCTNHAVTTRPGPGAGPGMGGGRLGPGPRYGTPTFR